MADSLRWAWALCLTTVALALPAYSDNTVIRVSANQVVNHLTPWMTGSCIEDVNHEIYGGLYDQKIFGESFEDPPLSAQFAGWTAYGGYWRLYRGRWAVEQRPHSARPMLGAERAFVFGQESRYRLFTPLYALWREGPELALLAGSLLSYAAATSAPVSSGFWDRAARPTCGRLRRALGRVHSAELPAHLRTGVEAHRRHKPERAPSQAVLSI